MSPEQTECLREIVALFDKAEQKLKEVEALTKDLTIPSVNELRYAGYHMARAFTTETDTEIDFQLVKAKNHCLRALYDAHEAGLMFMLAIVEAFQEEHKGFEAAVTQAIPSYTNLLVEVQKTKVFILDVADNNKDNREEYYKECLPHYTSIQGIKDTLEVSVPTIAGLIQQAERAKEEAELERLRLEAESAKASRRFALTISGTIFIVVIGLLGLGFKYLEYKNEGVAGISGDSSVLEAQE